MRRPSSWISAILPSLLVVNQIYTACLAHDSTGDSVQSSGPSSTISEQPSSTSSAPAQTHTIQVGLADHKFRPEATRANVGDTIQFEFYPLNHSVVRAEYGFPCIPYEMTRPSKIGFFGGFHPVDTVLEKPPSYSIVINDTDPIFFYCSAAGSCTTYGMVGAINPNASTSVLKQAQLAKDSAYSLNPGDAFPPESPLPSNLPSSAATADHDAAAKSDKKALSTGAIVSIAIGSAAVVVLAALLFLFWGRSETLKDEVERKACTIRRISPPSGGSTSMSEAEQPNRVGTGNGGGNGSGSVVQQQYYYHPTPVSPPVHQHGYQEHYPSQHHHQHHQQQQHQQQYLPNRTYSPAPGYNTPPPFSTAARSYFPAHPPPPPPPPPPPHVPGHVHAHAMGNQAAHKYDTNSPIGHPAYSLINNTRLDVHQASSHRSIGGRFELSPTGDVGTLQTPVHTQSHGSNGGGGGGCGGGGDDDDVESVCRESKREGSRSRVTGHVVGGGDGGARERDARKESERERKLAHSESEVIPTYFESVYRPRPTLLNPRGGAVEMDAHAADAADADADGITPVPGGGGEQQQSEKSEKSGGYAEELVVVARWEEVVEKSG